MSLSLLYLNVLSKFNVHESLYKIQVLVGEFSLMTLSDWKTVELGQKQNYTFLFYKLC